ncbi:MAG TPA: hypothetical protein VMT31_03075 [Methanomicrobiales archaeon]|jgi:hypothetical protein|nr:hypothetical protein [Methanomicrobiales archaeon]
MRELFRKSPAGIPKGESPGANAEDNSPSENRQAEGLVVNRRGETPVVILSKRVLTNSLFEAMLKEEWRIHSTMFGSAGFALFPLLLVAIATAGALMWPFFSDLLPPLTAVGLLHGGYLLAGMSVGGFGLFGREVMNRRFGQASLIAYSSRSLPVSERAILTAFLLKDTVYYLAFWVLPFVAGLAFAAPFIGLPLPLVLRLAATLSLSFLLGLSLVFLLSTIYVHSPRALLALFIVAVGAAIILAGPVNAGIVGLFPPLGLYYQPTPLLLLVTLLLIIVPSAISVRFLKVEYREETRRYPGTLDNLAGRLAWLPDPYLVAKDALDLNRSEGGAGKVVFSFLFPVAFIWIALFVLHRFIPMLSPLMAFAILLGVVSSTIYNWVTEFDLFSSHAFLPVEVKTVIRGKLESYGLLNLVSVAILVAAGLGTGQAGLLLPALLTFASLSFYAVAVTVYVGGLSPSVMLYNAKVYVPYLGLITPVLLFTLFVSLPNPWFALTSLVLIPAGWFVLKKAFTKWSTVEQPGF